MGDTLQISDVHKNFSKVIIMQGKSSLGKYLRIKKIKHTETEELPTHIISADKPKLIRSNYEGLSCKICGKAISSTNKIYFDENKYSEIPEVENGESFCENHWKNKKVAQQL